MGDIENRLGTTITMNNNAAMDERRSKWKFADFCVCWCIFIFIIVLFVVALVADFKNSDSEDPDSEEQDPEKEPHNRKEDTVTFVMYIILIVLVCLVLGFKSYSDRKKILKAELLKEGIVRTSGGSHPPVVH